MRLEDAVRGYVTGQDKWVLIFLPDLPPGNRSGVTGSVSHKNQSASFGKQTHARNTEPRPTLQPLRTERKGCKPSGHLA